MAEPEQKSQDALNESRILLLGVQVLLSFQYSCALEPAFDKLPYSSQNLELFALAFLMIAFGLFVAPAPNHLLVWSDDDGPNLQKFVTLAVAIALMPFAAALALDIYIAAARTAGMGTKEVLFQTRHLGWGTDTHLYRTLDELRGQLPLHFASGPRVLKQNRGNGGIGTWKVELAAHGTSKVGLDTAVRVLHARRGSVEEDLRLGDFMNRCERYLAGNGRMIDQPFQPRLSDGMIRCYMVRDEVAGFGHQLVKALMPSPPGTEPTQPGPRIMYGAAEPAFKALRQKMESDWTPAMMRLLDIDRSSLPVIWDADFLHGPKTESGEDTYVLCEINVSAVLPFPEQATAKIAQAAATSMLSAGKSRIPTKV